MLLHIELDAASRLVSSSTDAFSAEDIAKASAAAGEHISATEYEVNFGPLIPGLHSPNRVDVNSVGWMSISRRAQTARSVKMYNIKLEPLLAIRNGLSAAKEVGALATAGTLTALFQTGAVAIAGGVLAIPMAAMAIILSVHFARKKDVQYEHGCLFAIAWGVSEYVDGVHVFDEEELFASLELMKDFGIFDFTPDKARTALSRLTAWGMMEGDGPAHVLLERVTVRG